MTMRHRPPHFQHVFAGDGSCGDDTEITPHTPTNKASPSSGTIKAPSNLITAGTITFLSDTTYPPQESIDPSTQHAVGPSIPLHMTATLAGGLDFLCQQHLPLLR